MSGVGGKQRTRPVVSSPESDDPEDHDRVPPTLTPESTQPAAGVGGGDGGDARVDGTAGPAPSAATAPVETGTSSPAAKAQPWAGWRRDRTPPSSNGDDDDEDDDDFVLRVDTRRPPRKRKRGVVRTSREAEVEEPEQDESTTCPVCLEPWTADGDRRVVILKNWCAGRPLRACM